MSIQNNVDVVLIDTGFDGNPRFLLKERSQPHLGLAYIAAYLEEKEYRVKVIDRIVNPLTPAKVAALVIDCKPTVVGITTSTIDRFCAIAILDEIRKVSGDLLTVGGGPHFSGTAVDALEMVESLDVVCVGEGEYTMCEIVEAYIRTGKKNDFHDLDGIVYRDSEGQIVENRQRDLISDLDVLPLPAWHLFDIDKYTGTLATVPDAPYRAIGVGSSRGCPYSCAFCYNSLSKMVRNFSVLRFVDTIEELHEKYGFSAFNFVDDSFTCNPRRVMDICREIIDRKLYIKWYCSLNVNQAAKNLKMLETMKLAGCIALGFGVEFPHDKVLQAINKKSTTAVIKQALLNSKKAHYRFVSIFLLQGLPGQTVINTIRANLRILSYRRILGRGGVYFGGFVQIYPGTQLEELAKAQGHLAHDFSWNSPYVSTIAEKYQHSPNQQNKLTTVPIFVPAGITMENILFINRLMGYIPRAVQRGLRLGRRLIGKK